MTTCPCGTDRTSPNAEEIRQYTKRNKKARRKGNRQKGQEEEIKVG